MKHFFSITFIILMSNVFAQNTLEVKIEHITFSDTTSVINFQHDSKIAKTDSLNERKFTVTYHLKNISDATVRFYFNDPELNNLTFSVHQEDKIVAAFLTKEKEHNTVKYYLGAPPAEANIEDTVIPTNPDETLLRNSLFTLSPGQHWEFTQIFYWNKNQPNRKMNHQGYVDQGFPHFLTLIVNLRKYYAHLTVEGDFEKAKAEFDKIMKDDTFLGGTFSSEKAEINFD
ncbi:MAG: hypothetical protein PSV16_13015 [Flavobacterium sp.]|nr:hypothetical protein [Flavobacterium sp.]